MDVTYEEYKNWTETEIDPNVERKYKVALELLKPRQVLEGLLQTHKESENIEAHLETCKSYIGKRNF